MGRGTRVHFYRGHYIYPGRFKNSSDDVLGTWYIVHEDCSSLDLSGRGHQDLATARRSIDNHVGASKWRYSKIGGEWVACGLVDDADYIGSEIVVVTRRGERHIRTIVGVVRKLIERDGKALVYAKLADNHEVTSRAQKRYLSARLERLDGDFKVWVRYMDRTFDLAHSQFEDRNISLMESDLIQIMIDLENALEEYRRATVPKKHPMSEWLGHSP